MHAMGIDIGTTSISIVLIDEADGELIARETLEHDSFIDDGCPAGKVQDPQRLWRLTRDRVEALAAAHGAPSCIGLTGQMHGMLYVDAAGRAVSPLYTWQDGRGNLPLDQGESCVQILRRRGLSAASGYGITTHLYLTRRGAVPAEAAGMTTISDYIAMRLTGAYAPVLSADMAASWGTFDLRARSFTREALGALGMDVSLLPRVIEDHGIIGQTPSGVPVAASLGDNQASFIGSVRDMERTALINIGTGSQISAGTRGFPACAGGVELRPCTRGINLLVGSGLCGGRAYALLERFYRELCGAEDCYERMARQAADFLEEQGLERAWRVRTTFSGTRDDPGMRGEIRGIGVDNFRPGALTLGVIAGILEELRDAYGQMQSLADLRVDRLVGSGNGLRRNALMQRLAERLFGLDLFIPAHREEAAFGAALSAMAAAGRVSSLNEAQAMIRYLPIRR